MLPLAIMCQCYWCIGAMLGGLVGQLIPFSTEGIDFCMTALFTVIFVDQWEKAKSHVPAIVGLVVSLVCLFIFGAQYFLLPSLIIVSTILVIYNGSVGGGK